MPEYQERGILDPVSEGATNMPIEITGGMAPDGINGHAIGLQEWNFPRPEMSSTFISGVPSEGQMRSGVPRFSNRTIPVTVYIAESQGVDAADNLVTNPSFERDTAGWAVSGGALTSGGTLSRTAGSVLNGVAGEYSGLLIAGASNHGLGINVTLAATTDYVLRFRARKISGSVASLTGARVSTGIGSVTLSTEWQAFELPFTSAGAGAAFMSLRANASGWFAVDAVQVCLASQLYYFDGDTPGCKWNGTPHASTSTRKPLGRKRYLQSLYDLEAKVEKLSRSGGTLKRYVHDGTTEVFDVIEATFVGDWNKTMAQGQNAFHFELTCKPAARLAPITFPLRTKAAAKSILTGTEGPVPGNYPALGKLEITDTGTANRSFLLAALQSDRLDTSATGDVEYLAKNLTRLSGAALANTPGVAGNTNGGSTNGTVTATLTDGWAPLLSGKTLGGVYPTHQGSYRLWVRVWLPTGNTGEVQIRLEYSGSDLTRWVTNDPVTIPADAQEGAWNWIDLGMARLEPPETTPWGSSGAWRWEPRVAAMSTVPGDSIYFDALEVIPADEFYSESRANPQPASVSGGLVARGLGSAGASALAGRTPELGTGNWSGSGATDFQVLVEAGAVATRTPASSDSISWGGRFARLGTGVQAGITMTGLVLVQAMSAASGQGVIDLRHLITRYTDTNNFVWAGIKSVNIGGSVKLYLSIGKRKAGVDKTLASVTIPTSTYYGNLGVQVLPDGSATAWITKGSTFQGVAVNGPDADLATGGTLATGGYGIYHQSYYYGGASPSTALFGPPEIRSVITSDAPPDLVLSSGRKAFLTNDRSLRETADGTAVGEIGRYEGDRLLVPCSGQEGKQVRWVVMDSRVDPDYAADSNLDTLTGQLTVIPRVTDVPEPA